MYVPSKLITTKVFKTIFVLIKTDLLIPNVNQSELYESMLLFLNPELLNGCVIEKGLKADVYKHLLSFFSPRVPGPRWGACVPS